MLCAHAHFWIFSDFQLMSFLFISISVNAATHLLLAANSNHLLGKHFYFSVAFVWPFANILHNLGQDGNAGGGRPLIIFGSRHCEASAARCWWLLQCVSPKPFVSAGRPVGPKRARATSQAQIAKPCTIHPESKILTNTTLKLSFKVFTHQQWNKLIKIEHNFELSNCFI